MASPFQPLPNVSVNDYNDNGNNSRSDGKGSETPSLFETALRRKRILHVEFDRTLLAIRHTLLETAGFEVVSCFSAMAIREVSTATAPFDVFLVGHAASVNEREHLVTWMKANFPDTRVVVLRKRETDSSPQGVTSSTAEPENLIKTLVELLKGV
jgi:hypothetical protein